MTDIYDSDKRSEIMSKISGKDTKPEIIVRKYLFSQGFRFRKNVKSLSGKPDIVLPKYKIIIFIHGCFWHHHDCKASKLPKSNEQFWRKKINDNVIRDKKNREELEKTGWKMIVIWQCEIKNRIKREQRLNQLALEILAQ